MARFIGIFLSIFLFVLMAVLPGTAQDSGTNPPKKNSGPATQAGAKPVPLTPEITHRITSGIRSRYDVPPQVAIAISEPKAGTTPGYDDVVVTFTGGTNSTHHDFLISTDRKTLAHVEKIDISQDPMSMIDLQGRPVKGNPNAKVTLVNYDDFQCPFCARMHSTLFDTVFKDYADRIKVIYKDYPLIEIHPWAMHAAIDGNCLGEQNTPAYWDFADYIHANQRQMAGKSQTDAFQNIDNLAKEQGQKHQLDANKLQACIQKQDETAVRASMAQADKLGVDSTPTMFINGEKLTGVMTEAQLRAALDRALADSGQQAPPANAKN